MSISITACLAFTPPTYEAEDMATAAPQDLPLLVSFPAQHGSDKAPALEATRVVARSWFNPEEVSVDKSEGTIPPAACSTREPKTESSGLNVKYTMFLPDPTPGVAKAKLQDATLY